MSTDKDPIEEGNKKLRRPSPYMGADHPDAHKDMEKKPHPGQKYGHMVDYVVCPVCEGYGGHNLKLDAYGPGNHFRGACGQCFGWGWVKPGIDVTCIHTWVRETVRMFTHKETCQKCGKVRWIDSSD